MDPWLGGDQRLVFTFREPQEPVICGAEKTNPEHPRALASAHSDGPQQPISSGHRADDLHPARAQWRSRSAPLASPAPTLFGVCHARLLLLQKPGEFLLWAPLLHGQCPGGLGNGHQWMFAK